MELNLMYFCMGVCFAFLCAVFVYFWKKRKENRISKVLSYVLAVWLLTASKDVLLLSPDILLDCSLRTTLIMADMMIVPTSAFLLMELVKPGCVTPGRVVLHEAPFVLLGVWYFLTPLRWIYISMLLLSSVYGFAVVCYILYRIPKYHAQLKQTYSYSERIDLHWLYLILGLSICFLCLWSISCVLLTYIIDAMYYLIVVILWILISYFISKQEQVFFNLSNVPPENTVPSGKYAFSGQLEMLFSEKRLYLNPRLTIYDLAHELATNRTYISAYLNNELHTTFFDYVNGFRLIHAEKLLLTTNEPIDVIGERSGFNSESTFRRAFSRKNGCTPKQFRNKHSVFLHNS